MSEIHKRGFASMTPERRRELASKGGISAHKQGKAHQWNHEEAVEAGRKGGKAGNGGRPRVVPNVEG